MDALVDPFAHLQERCSFLIRKYIDPIIDAEQQALNNSEPLPDSDFDSVAAFRLLTHAELEGYFEKKAELALAALDSDFRKGRVAQSGFASLIFLYLLKKKIHPDWSPADLGGDGEARKGEYSDFKKLAQEALGYGRQFIESNNGIKANSIYVLSALMGYFEDELDSVLVQDLNQYGIKRGDVAHDSWTKNTRTFESAEIEKSRLERILELTKNFYERSGSRASATRAPTVLEHIFSWFSRNR
jgi:hypothetical protein